MRRQARKRGVDLLIVDSGDLHDGAGLSDGYPAGQGPDAHVSNQ
jgi:2',3'-cyclic-nucleotide 2'-phosphodiesterase (5'-nucleotidase family)